MNRFEELISSVSTNLSVVVHLGAGSCQEYEVYKALHADRVIFVEPNPILAEKAREQFSDFHDVTILECAISPKKGLQVLNVTNNRRFSSLLKPTGLMKFYPNIEIIQETEVETQTLESLCQQSKISDKANNFLIAELQGLEGIVFSTTKADTLQKFNWIIIRASVNGQYHIDTEDAKVNLIEKMKEAGFTVLTFNEDAPSFINILCIRNEAVLDNERLRIREEDLNNTVRVIEHNFSKSIAELNAQKTMYKKKISKLMNPIKTKVRKVPDYVQSITAEKASQQQEITELSAQIESKAEELSQVREKIKLTASEKDSLQAQVNKLIDSENEKLTEIKEMQQTMRINNKLMLKSDTDLKELQLQYRSVVQHQEQQQSLLSELKEKLRQASAYYQKLNLQNLVLDGDMLEENDPHSIEASRDENNSENAT